MSFDRTPEHSRCGPIQQQSIPVDIDDGRSWPRAEDRREVGKRLDELDRHADQEHKDIREEIRKLR